jgi:hypothetical protein
MARIRVLKENVVVLDVAVEFLVKALTMLAGSTRELQQLAPPFIIETHVSNLAPGCTVEYTEVQAQLEEE